MSMSCEPCKRAGDLLTAWKKGKVLFQATTLEPLTDNQFYEHLRNLHGQCKGKAFCYCQHSTSTNAVAT